MTGVYVLGLCNRPKKLQRRNRIAFFKFKCQIDKGVAIVHFKAKTTKSSPFKRGLETFWRLPNSTFCNSVAIAFQLTAAAPALGVFGDQLRVSLPSPLRSS